MNNEQTTLRELRTNFLIAAAVMATIYAGAAIYYLVI